MRLFPPPLFSETFFSSPPVSFLLSSFLLFFFSFFLFFFFSSFLFFVSFNSSRFSSLVSYLFFSLTCSLVAVEFNADPSNTLFALPLPWLLDEDLC